MIKKRTQLSCITNKRNEVGRSMVEMLGVLAIIGILSVTGIYGYTVAMRQYQANEIAQTASMLAIMAQAADHGSGDCLELSQTNLPKNPGGVSVDMAADPTSNYVDIFIKNMDTESVTELCAVIQGLSPIVDACGNADEAKCQ